MRTKFEVRITSDDYLNGLPSWCLDYFHWAPIPGETIDEAISYVMSNVVGKIQDGQKVYISKFGMRQNEHLWDYSLA